MEFTLPWGTLPCVLFSQEKKRIFVAYMREENSKSYETFRRVAGTLKDDCAFYAGFGYLKNLFLYHILHFLDLLVVRLDYLPACCTFL